MIIADYLKNKHVAIFGLGKTGLGALRSMIASEAIIYASDDDVKIVEKYAYEYPEAKITSYTKFDWKKIEYLILSPGVSVLKERPHPVVKLALKHDVEIISDLDILYLSNPKGRYIGITGTNGKSTTTALIGHIIRESNFPIQVGGNIGNSVLELDSFDDRGFYVIEVSSFQLEISKHIRFDVAVLLNITPDHLDRHGSMENYINAKVKIFERCTSKDFQVISIDYDITKKIYKKLSRAISFSNHNSSADIYMKDRILKDGDLTFDFKSYSYLPGKHNEENIMAAYAACKTSRLRPNQIVENIRTFKGLKHRIEKFHKTDRLVFINDSKATNAEAVEKAFNCYDDIYWIAGGISKEGGIEMLVPNFKKIKCAYLIGLAQKEFAKVLEFHKVKYKMSGNLENALDTLKRDKEASGVVLLSPACASYDQFSNFEHRGDEFCRLVKEKFNDGII